MIALIVRRGKTSRQLIAVNRTHARYTDEPLTNTARQSVAEKFTHTSTDSQ
jgi:hypothetical protein